MPKSCIDPTTCKCNVHTHLRSLQRQEALRNPPVGQTSNVPEAAPEIPVWETVTDDTSRLKVPGGWIYRTIWFSQGDVQDACAVFVPNPEY